MTSPDDEIIAALRHSPGDPPPTDLYGRVAAGVRRRRQRRALGAAGVAACLVAAIAILPVVLHHGRTTSSPPSGPVQSVTSPPTCASTLDAQPSGGPTPAGTGLVPGTPTSAVLCEYDQTGQPQPLTRHAALDSGQLEKTLLILRELPLTNEVPSCPHQPTVDLLIFGYSNGSTATLQIGCAMVWRTETAHAMLNDLVSGQVDAILGGTPSSPPPSSAAPVVIKGGGVVLELDDAQQFHIVNLDTGASSPVALQGIPGGPSMIAANPSGGWVVTFTPEAAPQWGQAPEQLAVVDAAGKVVPFGPVYPLSTPISGLAVSPDGSQVAIALMQAYGDPAPASIVAVPMPGHASATRSWSSDDININEIIDLSWAPDGRRLTYIAGLQTGAGIAGDPVTLDTSKLGVAPTISTWTHHACSGVGVAWLGASGKLAIVDDCSPNAVLRTVDVATGAPAGPTVQLPGHACLEATVHPS
ncbi:MAG TPA: hypothetical protein VFN80_04070, partial [Acidothermaceae bacterium]|nr:hypothetical protein [Acidothermaceae bacterium]